MEKTRFMQACREGGVAIEHALRELDRAFFAALYRDALRTLGDPDAAHDLVQETFIKVWRRCGQFRGDSELLSWIKVILRNGALERLRRPTREVPMEDHDGLTRVATIRIAELSQELNGTPERSARDTQLAAVFKAGWRRFQTADPLHANVLAWVVEDGLTIDDIAGLLGRTPGATREFVSQCRKRARIHLADWYALASERSAAS